MSDASQNVNVSCESAVMHKPGDTLLISKPFSFVIFSSHRFVSQYLIDEYNS